MVSTAVETVLEFLDTHIPGFQTFHSWANSVIDEQVVLTVGVLLIGIAVFYVYKKFPYK